MLLTKTGSEYLSTRIKANSGNLQIKRTRLEQLQRSDVYNSWNGEVLNLTKCDHFIDWVHHQDKCGFRRKILSDLN